MYPVNIILIDRFPSTYGGDGDVATAEALLSMAGRTKESRKGENTFLSLILLTAFFGIFVHIWLGYIYDQLSEPWPRG